MDPDFDSRSLQFCEKKNSGLPDKNPAFLSLCLFSNKIVGKKPYNFRRV